MQSSKSSALLSALLRSSTSICYELWSGFEEGICPGPTALHSENAAFAKVVIRGGEGEYRRVGAFPNPMDENRYRAEIKTETCLQGFNNEPMVTKTEVLTD